MLVADANRANGYTPTSPQGAAEPPWGDVVAAVVAGAQQS